MCGIAGVIGSSNHNLVRAMVTSIRHRGPDDEGFYFRPDLAVGACRLSIIDLSGGHQPIESACSAATVVLNGEIYNHRALRRDLCARDHRFLTRCDTETIVHLYEESGLQVAEDLRGMFAFAIADNNRLILARDRYGIKPLYYYVDPRGSFLLFSSEIKALVNAGVFVPELNVQALVDQYVIGYPPDCETAIAGIRAVPPGTIMTVEPVDDRLDIRSHRYAPSFAPTPDAGISASKAVTMVRDAITESVRAHLLSDVPIGVLLSGGLDSSLLARTVRELTGDAPRTFTAADQRHTEDAFFARAVANEFGCRHTERVFTWDEFIGALPLLTWVEEKPSSLMGVSALLLLREVANHVKVCLIGEGADEVFGGYPEYLWPANHVRPALGRLERVSRAGFHPSDAAMTLVEQLQSIAAGDDQALLRLFEINLAGQLTHRHLTVMDQWSMAWGVELRVPFVDPAVIDLAHTLPLAHRVDRRISFGKLVLREWALQTGSPALKEIAMRPKIGLPTSSYRHRERFTKLCDQELPDDYLADHPLRALFDRKRDVLMFELFREIYINRRGAHPGAMSVLEFMETQKSPVRERRAAH